MKKILVNSDHKRLDNFLVEHLKINKSSVNKIINSNVVYINSKLITKNGTAIYVNDIIEIHDIEKKKDDNHKQYDFNIDIKYEDNDLIIVYKPSGMLTHATLYNELETLENAIRFYAKNQWEPLILHRLDKDTSGLLIFAKNKKTQEIMLEKFQNKEIIKKYYAIVNQPLNNNHLLIDVPISRSNDNKMKMIAGNFKNAKQALTEVYVKKNWKKFALLDILLHTGRTHQIRVHMKYINHPIFNDPLYSYNKTDDEYGQYLMAYKLEFDHPISKQKISICIDMDQEFINLIEKIQNEI